MNSQNRHVKIPVSNDGRSTTREVRVGHGQPNRNVHVRVPVSSDGRSTTQEVRVGQGQRQHTHVRIFNSNNGRTATQEVRVPQGHGQLIRITNINTVNNRRTATQGIPRPQGQGRHNSNPAIGKTTTPEVRGGQSQGQYRHVRIPISNDGRMTTQEARSGQGNKQPQARHLPANTGPLRSAQRSPVNPHTVRTQIDSSENVQWQDMIQKIGAHCTRCRDRDCYTKYTGLCAVSEAVKDHQKRKGVWTSTPEHDKFKLMMRGTYKLARGTELAEDAGDVYTCDIAKLLCAIAYQWNTYNGVDGSFCQCLTEVPTPEPADLDRLFGQAESHAHMQDVNAQRRAAPKPNAQEGGRLPPILRNKRDETQNQNGNGHGNANKEVRFRETIEEI